MYLNLSRKKQHKYEFLQRLAMQNRELRCKEGRETLDNRHYRIVDDSMLHREMSKNPSREITRNTLRKYYSCCEIKMPNSSGKKNAQKNS